MNSNLIIKRLERHHLHYLLPRRLHSSNLRPFREVQKLREKPRRGWVAETISTKTTQPDTKVIEISKFLITPTAAAASLTNFDSAKGGICDGVGGRERESAAEGGDVKVNLW